MSTWIPIIRSLCLFAIAPRTVRIQSHLKKTPSGVVIGQNRGGFRAGLTCSQSTCADGGNALECSGPARDADAEVVGGFGAVSIVRRVTSCFLAPLMQPGHVFNGCVRWKKEERVGQSALNRVWNNTEGHCRPEPTQERSEPRGSPRNPAASDWREGVATCPRCHLWSLAEPMMFPTDAPAFRGPGDTAEYVVTYRTLWPRNSGLSCHL